MHSCDRDHEGGCEAFVDRFVTANLSYVKVTVHCDTGLVYSCPDGLMISITYACQHRQVVIAC